MKTNLYPLLSLIILVALGQSCRTVKKNVWVAGYKQECSMGAGAGQCLVVLDGNDLNNGKWENFSSPVEGFTYQDGQLQNLRIKETKLKKNEIPADGSSLQFSLIRVIETKPDPRMELQGTWTPVTINENKIPKQAALPSMEIDLASGMIFGTDGCNRFSAKISTLTLSKLQTMAPAGTKKACPRMETANGFNSSFATVRKYEIKKGKLIFYDEFGKNRLEFIKGPATNTDEIAGAWVAVRVNGNPINRKTPAAFLDINAANMYASGNDGCNNYRVEIVNLNDGRIKFGAGPATEKACPKVDTKPYHKAMSEAASYQISGDTLTFFDENGKEVLAMLKRK